MSSPRDDADGNGASGYHDDSLQAMRNNFFGTPQEAGNSSLRPATTVTAAPSYLNDGDATPRRTSLPAVVVATPLHRPGDRGEGDSSTSNSGQSGEAHGMSAARKYFSVGATHKDDSSERGNAASESDAPRPAESTVRFHAVAADDNAGEFSDRESSPTTHHTHDTERHHAAVTMVGSHNPEGLSDLELIHKARAEEQAIIDQRPPPRPLTADEMQEARMRAYDEVCGTSTWDFLRETAQAVVPDAVNDLVDRGTETVVRTSESIIPEGVRRAADKFGSAANTAGHAIEAVPKLMVSAIPSALMSDDTKQMLFGDFTNTLRSFYHTNVLSIPFVMNQAGLIGGIVLLLVVSFTSEYATEAFFGAKNQLRDARRVVTYGDVPRLTWGTWYPSLNLFYGITHLIGFIAFSASNTRVLLAAMGLTGGGAMAVSLIVPSVISLPLVFIKRDVDQKPYAVISSFIVFVSVICMFTYFPYNSTKDVKLWADSASDYFVALGVTVYAFTGIGSCTPIERTMRPRRYVKCLRAAVSLSCAVLLAFGLSGFLSYGNKTCSVITVSLQPGPMKTAVSALLFVASIAIIPQQTFPLCELCDRRLLGIRHVPGYWELKPNLLRIGALVVSAIAAWIVPYYGLLLSISGALGCGTVGIIVPAAMDYVRRARWGLRDGRHLFWWEYLIVFGLGTYGCAVVIIGVTFGMYKLWITIQTNASDTC